MIIQRIFCPIGQGAFYIEKHKDYNIVYDCGNWKNEKFADFVIKQSFKETDIIDILFISHFDSDHINKINVLKNHCKTIKNVVLPILHDNEKIILTNFYKSLNKNHILKLIENPQSLFSEETKI